MKKVQDLYKFNMTKKIKKRERIKNDKAKEKMEMNLGAN